jgi:gliding motility-associated-like protein
MLIDTFHVGFRPLPPSPPTRDTFYCVGYGSPASLTVQVTSVDTLKWYLPGGALYGYNPPLVNTGSANYPTGTIWTVTQTEDGCEGPPSNVKVTIVPPPAISISARSWVCQFDSISLTYIGPALVNGGFTWSLPPGAYFANGTSMTDSEVYVRFDSANNNTVVHLTATNLYGQCPNDSSITIDVVKLPTAHATTKTEVCLSDTVNLALSDRSADASDFVWYVDTSPLSGATSLNIISSNTNTGGPFTIQWIDAGRHIIHVQAFAEHGCKDIPTADTVNVHAAPDASFTYTTRNGTLCLEDSVLFSANYNSYQNSYMWAPEHSFNNISKSITWGQLEQAQSIISLTVTDPFGCIGSSSKELDPGSCCTILFPNAFTPNGDGNNDFFRPVIYVPGYHRYHMFRVQNRWGQTVFESLDNKAEWDGNFNGVPQEMGVYFYYLKYDCGGKTLEEKGDVTLVR